MASPTLPLRYLCVGSHSHCVTASRSRVTLPADRFDDWNSTLWPFGLTPRLPMLDFDYFQKNYILPLKHCATSVRHCAASLNLSFPSLPCTLWNWKIPSGLLSLPLIATRSLDLSPATQHCYF